MAHSHYVLDLYYPGEGDIDLLRREVMRIEARDDVAAIEEGIRISGWRHPVRFDVRAITNSARKGDRLVHTAATADEGQQAKAAAGDTIVLGGSKSESPQRSSSS
ncbi:MAG: hypothetical protein ABL879_10845 [Devosia sp.]